jgi:guanylate kinase
MDNPKPKLIILYGFAGIGKSTLAKRLNIDKKEIKYL